MTLYRALNLQAKWLLACMLLCFLSIGHFSAQTINPFDVYTPEAYEQLLDSLTSEGENTAFSDTLLKHEEIHVSEAVQGLEEESSESLSDWFLAGYAFVLILLVALIFSVGRNEVEKSWRAFFNQNALNNLYKEKIEFKYTIYLLLYLLYFLVMGLLIYQLVLYFGFAPVSNHGIVLLGSLGVIVGLILAKHFILWVISFIFPIEKSLTKYNFLIVIFNQIIAIAILPLLIIHLFAPEQISTYALITAIFTIGFIYLVRSFRGLLLSSDYLVSNKFHFFLYLCSVEIAPLAIAIRIITDL